MSLVNSEDSRKLSVIVVFQNIREQKITRFDVEVHRLSTFGDVRSKISSLTAIAHTKLIFCEYVNNKIFGIIPDFYDINKFGVNDLIVAHELNEMDKYVRIHVGFNFYFDEIALGIFGYSNGVRHFSGSSKSFLNMKVLYNLQPIFDCHFFLPVYHSCTQHQTTSKDFYDRCLEKFLQYIPTEDSERILEKFPGLEKESERSEYFPKKDGNSDLIKNMKEDLEEKNIFFQIYLLEKLRNYHSLYFDSEGNNDDQILLSYDSNETIITQKIQEFSEFEDEQKSSRNYLTPIEREMRVMPSMTDRKYPIIFVCLNIGVVKLLRKKRGYEESGFLKLLELNVQHEINFVKKPKKISEDLEDRILFLKEDMEEYFEGYETPGRILTIDIHGSFYGQFVSIQKHYKNDTCSSDSLGSVIITDLPSPCIELNDVKVSKIISYEASSQKIKVTVFDDEGCIGNNKTSFYTLSNCSEAGDGFVNGWYLNFTIINELPFNSTPSSFWMVEERYDDGICVDPLTHYSDDYQISARKSTIEFRSLLYYVPLCSPTEGWEAIVFYNWIGEFMYYEFYPRNCSLFFQDDHKTDTIVFYYSFRKYCLNDTDFRNKYMSLIDKPSPKSYDFNEYYFDSTCKNPYMREVRKLDECGEFGPVSTKYRNGIDYRSKLIFEDSGCKYDKLVMVQASMYDDNNTNLVGHCKDYKQSDVHSSVEMYRKFYSEETCYLPHNLASFMTSIPCGENIDSIRKNPGLQRILYYDEEYCICGFETTGYIRGRCENGNITAKVFPVSGNTVRCYGEYEVLSTDALCFEYIPGVYHHLTCIPQYCGEYSEHDKRVCNNGKGICVWRDTCECSEGYEGTNCEHWNCGKYHKNHDFACYGRGECKAPDVCECFRGFSGKDCGNNDALYAAGISLAGASPIFMLVLICCCCSCCCCYLVVLSLGPGILLVSSFAGSVGVVAMIQKKSLKKFKELDDFEILLQEQLAEKDVSMAHLKINKKLFEVEYNDIKIISVLGEGGSDAIVFLASWSNQRVAFKCFKTKRLCESQDKFNQFEQEVNLLANLNHPNIIRFFGATLKPPRVGILMEYCCNGEILDFLKKYKKEKKKSSTLVLSSNTVNYSPHKYPIQEKIRFCKEIISSIEFVHSKSIIHRDVKPENILIDDSEHCKLMDFGISKLLVGNSQTKSVGTSAFMAPEVATGDKYDFKTDSFSFSILVFCIFTEKGTPYKDGDFRVELKVANDPSFRPDLKDFMKSMGHDNVLYAEWLKNLMVINWSHSPENRMTSSEICEYLKGDPTTKIGEHGEELLDEEDSLSSMMKKKEFKIVEGGEELLFGENESSLRKRVLGLEDEKKLLEEKISEIRNLYENENEKLKTEIEKLKSV